MSSAKIESLEERIRELEAELEVQSALHARYQKLFEMSGDALSILDLDTGRFIECNQSAIDMHGVESEENFLNLRPSDISPEFQPCGGSSEVLAIERIKKTFSEGPQVFQWTHSRLDGSTFPCLVSLSALPVDDKKLVLAIGRDISDLINAQQELANEVAIKDRFFSIIAHDLRSPFTALLGMSQLLAESPEKLTEAQRDEYKVKVHESAKRVYGLLDELLDWARLQMEQERVDLKPASVIEVIEEAVSLMTPLAQEKGVTIETDPTDLMAKLDKNLSRLVIRNLVSNAIKFTPADGTIYVGASEADGKALIKVHDTGVGIAEDVVGDLFNVDTKTTSAGTAGEAGTGLGLPLCAQIADLHGGSLTVDSVEGQGSIFTFSVPIA